MNFTQLKYAITLANEGNFTKAAEKLYITQPTLSIQIKELDEETNKYRIINKDPIEIIDNANLFLIENINGGPIKITAGQLNILVDLILRIKPLEQVVLLNIILI